MKGICPHCYKNTSFRKLTFRELDNELLRGGSNFLSGDIIKKITNIFDEIVGSSWENYKCNSCERQVHTCGECGSIEPYQDFGAICSKCGYI